MLILEHSGYCDRYAAYQARQVCLRAIRLSVPSKEMYEYAAQASLGDDVYHEPNTSALEAHVARLFGKEAAVFVASGTMSNQLATRTHLEQPPYSIVCDHRAHIYKCEGGGLAFHTGAQTIPVIPSNGKRLIRVLCHLPEPQPTAV